MLNDQNNFILQKLSPVKTTEELLELWDIESFDIKITEVLDSPAKTIYTFHTQHGPIIPWLENVIHLFPGVDFEYVYFDVDQLIAGIFLVRANSILLDDYYKKEDPKATKSVRGFVNYLAQTLEKEVEIVEQQFSKELYNNKLKIDQISVTTIPSKDPNFSTVTLTSPYTDLVFTADLPRNLFINSDRAPYAILKEITLLMPKQYKLLSCFSSTEKLFSIREVALIMTSFDLTEEGHCWQNQREDFNEHAQLHGFRLAEHKKWKLNPLNFQQMLEMLQNSQNGQTLMNNYEIHNLSFHNNERLIELASKCGYLLYDNLFYLAIDYDSLY